MKVSIITIGDEILIGQIVDTNSAWIAQRLNEIGLQLRKIYSISDSSKEIFRTLDRASELSDICIITGGLGPTNDDITKNTLAEYFNDNLERNYEILDHIKELFNKSGYRKINKLNEQQADLPTKCKLLRNQIGTASGMWFEEKNKHFISMPGVPREMKKMMHDIVLPELEKRFSKGVVLHKTILTQGIPESILAEILTDWEASLNKRIKLAYLPSENRVRIRLSIIGLDSLSLKKIIDYEVKKLKALIPESIFGEDDDSIEQRVGDLLTNNNSTVATAESCTGGYLAHLITSIPGSSSYFKGSVLAYDNEIKKNILGVKNSSIIKYGAVSEQVVKEMALSLRKLMGVDYALSSSGIAGPSGGSEQKPVGTIWTAIAGPNGVKAVKYQFGKDRLQNIKSSASAILLDLIHLLDFRDKKIE